MTITDSLAAAMAEAKADHDEGLGARVPHARAAVAMDDELPEALLPPDTEIDAFDAPPSSLPDSPRMVCRAVRLPASRQPPRAPDVTIRGDAGTPSQSFGRHLRGVRTKHAAES